MEIRYALLPYMYTLFNSAHTTGSTVMQALSWNFPNDARLAAADRQFMLGSSVLITPVLEQGTDHVYGVFPGKGKEMWYDWYNQSRITSPAALKGDNVSIPASLGHIPVFVRGGSVLAMQPLGDALTIREVRDHAWTVLVGLDCAGEAARSLYIDDGESIRPDATLEVVMTVSNHECKTCRAVS
jgi:alpha-glucosidase